MIENILFELARTSENRKKLRAKVKHLSEQAAADCLEELMCHIDVHISQKCFPQADTLLRICSRLVRKVKAKSNPSYFRRLMRKRLSWLESQKMLKHSALLIKKMHDHCVRPEDGEAINAFRTGELLMDLTSAYSRLGQTAKAVKAASKAVKLFESRQDNYNFTAASFNKASLLYDQQRYAESTALCIDILPNAEKYNDLNAGIMLQLANNLEALKMPMRACQFYGKAMIAYSRLDNKKQQADISNRIGWIMLKKEEFELSLRTLRTAFILKAESEMAKTLLRQNYLRGQALRGSGLYEKARRCFLINIVIAEQHKNSTYLSLSRHGFYQVRCGMRMNLRSAMTASSISGSSQKLVNFASGFVKLKGEGYSLPPFTELKKASGHAMTIQEKRSMRSLLDDLIFCAGAKNTGDVKFYKKQIAAFLNL